MTPTERDEELEKRAQDWFNAALIPNNSYSLMDVFIAGALSEREIANGWKKIDRKDYPKNYEKMKYSQGFMEEYVNILKEELNRAEAAGFMKAVEMLRSAEAGLWKHEENTNHDWADWLLEQREKGK